MKKTIQILLERIGGLILFIILLAIGNIFIESVPIVAQNLIVFFNSNITLLIFITLFLMIGEIMGTFILPFNLVAPPFNAVGGVLMVIFIINMLAVVGSYVGFILPYALLKLLISMLVFFIVLIVGFIGAFMPKQIKCVGKIKKTKRKKKKSKVEWEDVGEEFKMALYNLASTIKENLKPKRKK